MQILCPEQMHLKVGFCLNSDELKYCFLVISVAKIPRADVKWCGDFQSHFYLQHFSERDI